MGTTLRATKRLPVLNGLEIGFDRHFLPVPEGLPSSKYLVLIVSDSCRFSAAQMKVWATVLTRIHFTADDRLILVGTHGTGLVNTLAMQARAQNLVVQQTSITSVPRFAQETGIGWTPETLVLDENRRVRIASEVVTPIVFDEIMKFFSSEPAVHHEEVSLWETGFGGGTLRRR